MTVAEAIADTTERLRRAGCSSPRVDSERLVENTVRTTRTALYTEPERPLTTSEYEVLAACVERRCRREPLAYILGEWGFRHLTLQVTPAVLIPRPETELLVERCLEHLLETDQPAVIDIGTGSGAIALSIASECPGAQVTAVDKSSGALAIAETNARALELGHRVCFVEGDLFADAPGPFDLVVSNPPYVLPEDYGALQPEILNHEPREALVGAGFHQRIADQALDRLRLGGWLLMECGEREAEGIGLELERLPGYESVDVVSDLSGRPRFVEAARADRKLEL
jgi:release factor glutamine methyltransferase